LPNLVKISAMHLNLWLVAGLFLILAAFGTVVFGRKQAVGLRVVSWNIRYDNPGDGEHRWAFRKARVIQYLRQQSPDVVGLQEVLHGQLRELDTVFSDRYSWVGVGRDDGHEAGEFSPVGYNHHKLELLQQGTLWLSETPGQPSKGWDAALPRICSWAQFRHKTEKREFWVFNTHFDHAGLLARQKSAQLLADSFPAWCQGQAVLLMGDFNEGPDGAVVRHLLLAGLTDSRLVAEAVLGSTQTYHGFKKQPGTGSRIDYIFYQGWPGVGLYEVPLLADEKGHYASDHAPVVVEMKW